MQKLIITLISLRGCEALVVQGDVNQRLTKSFCAQRFRSVLKHER